MYKNHSILIVICARGGSKDLLKKNIKYLCGKPLISHTIEQAKRIAWIKRIVVSTDDEEIRSVAEKYGIEVPFLRPKELATDKISVIPAIIHAVQTAEDYWKEKYDIVVNLSPTGPLRIVEDIKLVIKTLVDALDTDAVFSVVRSHDNPYFNMVEIDGKGYAGISKKGNKPVARRQDAPEVYTMNGSIYAIWKHLLFEGKSFFTDKTRAYVMPKARSVDIDDGIDFKLAEFFLKKQSEK